jgi:hypothetical protein
MLCFNPKNRLDAKTLLSSAYVKRFRNEREEASCREAIRVPVPDCKKLSVKEYRSLVYCCAERNRMTDREYLREEKSSRCEFTVRKHFRVSEDRRHNLFKKRKNIEKERHSFKEVKEVK